MKEPRIPVAKEGYPFIGFSAFAALFFSLLDYDAAAVTFFFITAFVLYFFRDPDRIVPDTEEALVSPADGKVILVDKIFDDRFINDHVYKISIFMNIFDVHVNRFPSLGTVEAITHRPGRFYSANTERGALQNEFCALAVSTDSGERYVVVQVAGLIARRIVCWAVRGERLDRGQRFGIIRFGSRVDLYLPLHTRIEVSPGQRVKAGETLIGYLA